MKKIALLILLVFGLSGCTVEVESIDFDQSNYVLLVGETVNSITTVFPDDATDPSLTYSSSNESVAKVFEGLIIGESKGTSVITAQALNGVSKSVTVTVGEAVRDLNLQSSSNLIDINDELNINISITPQDALYRNINWRSSNNNVIVVDANGKIRAVNPGTAEITAVAHNGIQRSIEITVKQPVVSISLSAPKNTINVLESSTITATINPQNATDQNLRWISSNTNVLTVNENGTIRGITPGTATITAISSNGITESVSITVLQLDPTSINLNSSQIGLLINDTFQLQATVAPSNANSTITWTSSNNSVARVSTGGMVTGVSDGFAVITARTTNGLTKSTVVYVRFDIGDYNVDELEPNGTMALADPIIRNGTTIFGNNSSKQDFDVYRFSLPANVNFRFVLAPDLDVDLDYFLTGLYDQSDNLLRAGLVTSELLVLDFTITRAGTYYVYVIYSSISPYSKGDDYVAYALWE
jgi:uncharacterized protein YjdB